MRLIAALSLCVALPISALAEGHWPGPGDIVEPTAIGLMHYAEDGAPRGLIPFGAGFQDMMHIMVAIFGQDMMIGFPAECGAGPMVSAQIPGQIDLMFKDDQFVGWMLIGDGALVVADTDLHVGATREALEAVAPVAYVESGIGTEFAMGDLYGLMSEDEGSVQAIWAGTNCVFR